MSHELICSWLEISGGSWPPDHYRLLGLNPGEGDVALIEQRVHQRLDAIRRYQMMYPEQATEVMNRLAQAFICLTEPGAKRAYDEQLLGKGKNGPPPLPLAQPVLPVPQPVGAVVVQVPPPLPVAVERVEQVSVMETIPERPLPFQWLGNRDAEEPGDSTIEDPIPIPVAPLPSPPPPEEPARAAARSRAARRGLATRRGIYRRLWATRNLLRLWKRMGKFLAEPERRFSTNDARDLYRVVELVEVTSEDFPLLGELGMPGYYILNLGQLDRTRNLRNLTQGQRELLQNDWRAGLAFLEAYRDVLHEEAAAAKRRGLLGRFRHALNAAISDHPMPATLILGGAVALAIVVGRWLL